MAAPTERPRTHPAERFAGAEHVLDLPAALEKLRGEGRRGDTTSSKGHRQISLLHHGPVRMVLYAFDADGRLPEHGAPGWVTIHVLRGALEVRTSSARHTLREGQLLALAPDVRHDVHALEAAEMLLGVYPTVPTGTAGTVGGA
jgi:quercetin dioxygenase-like cupin family protein